jgi:hypothetical protein
MLLFLQPMVRKMGQSLGTPKGITRDRLLKGTESSRDIIQKLFKRFLDTLTPEELLELSNPAACNKYVFVMANALHRIFSELKIVPTKDRSGVLLFQKADTLTKKDTQDENFRRNCLEVSYFYIRIFQIFGALALTVVDSPGAGHVAAAYQAQVDAKGQPLGTIGARGVVLAGGERPPYDPYGLGIQQPYYNPYSAVPQRPGQVVGKKNAFTVFYENGYLTAPIQGAFYPFKAYPQTMMFLYSPSKYSKIHYRHRDIDIRADISLRAPGLLTLKAFSSYDRATQQTKAISNYNYVFTIPYQKVEPSTLYDIAKNQDVERSIHDIMELTYQYKKNPDDLNILEQIKMTVAMGSEKQLAAIAKQPGQKVYPQPAGYPGQVGVRGQPGYIPTRSDVGSLSSLQSGYLRDILSGIRGKPVAFCVARALQLIDANVLTSMPKVLQSGICKTSFDTMPGSTPIPGKSLDTYRPLFAVDQLFYNKKVIKPDPTTGVIKSEVQIGDPNAHKDFVQSMMTWFGRPGATVSTDSPLSSVGIVNKYCQDSTFVGKTLQIKDPKAIQQIVSGVNQLFAFQLNHTKKVMDFLGRFLVKFVKAPGGGTIVSLHPGLLVGGVGQLEKVSTEARKLLVSYYENCEKIYKVAAEIAKANGSLGV